MRRRPALPQIWVIRKGFNPYEIAIPPLQYPQRSPLELVDCDFVHRTINICFLSKQPRFVHRLDTRVLID